MWSASPFLDLFCFLFTVITSREINANTQQATAEWGCIMSHNSLLPTWLPWTYVCSAHQPQTPRWIIQLAFVGNLCPLTFLLPLWSHLCFSASLSWAGQTKMEMIKDFSGTSIYLSKEGMGGRRRPEALGIDCLYVPFIDISLLPRAEASESWLRTYSFF